MAFTEGSFKSFLSTNDLSAVANQNCIVKMDSAANSIVLAAAGTDKSIGILQNSPKAGGTANVRMRSGGSTAQVIAGGTVNIGDPVTSDSSGHAVVTTTAGHQILGYALYAAASGDVFEIELSTGKF